jgi:hypothetical protein
VRAQWTPTERRRHHPDRTTPAQWSTGCAETTADPRDTELLENPELLEEAVQVGVVDVLGLVLWFAVAGVDDLVAAASTPGQPGRSIAMRIISLLAALVLLDHSSVQTLTALRSSRPGDVGARRSTFTRTSLSPGGPRSRSAVRGPPAGGRSRDVRR